ncbi:Nuclear cap-binding protein subunit 3 [Porphyridium purpureum]|uniref:Nuclear cap-binding protein subunit 3 n=1 Tax=Porphyridium purpureum TaxID=35688 RepID=A0A5J4Z076_PORPP|nr:Nuclear cap-binding protein subunit 3 [Porphyridium purpureum]|eukprot:POR1550..scf208_2
MQGWRRTRDRGKSYFSRWVYETSDGRLCGGVCDVMERSAAEDGVQPVGEIQPVALDGVRAHTHRHSQQQPSVDELVNRQMEEARKKHEQRAARFGVPLVRPKETAVLGVRRYTAAVAGLGVGFDPTSEEELRKGAARAKRFNLDSSAHEVLAGAGDAGNGSADASAPPLPEAERTPLAVLEPPRYVNPNEEDVRPNALHVHGVDALSTPEIVDLFGSFGPRWVEWVNDSACNVVFNEHFGPRRAMRALCVEVEESRGQWCALERDEPVSDDVALLKWRRSRPVEIPSRRLNVTLLMRAATMLDVRPDKPNPKSKWSRTVRAQRSHNNQMGFVPQHAKRVISKR